MAQATTDPIRLPPSSRLPKLLQAGAFLVSKHAMFTALIRRYDSSVIGVNLPHNNNAVVVSDPTLIREVLNSSSTLIERPGHGDGSIGEAFGPGSTFSLVGEEHRKRRKLLASALHGRRMHDYNRIIEEEVRREIATWPEGREFETLKPMLRITVGAILRAVLGAEGAALDELRQTVPAMTTLASLLVVGPSILRRNLGPLSPWARFLRKRRRFDAIIASLIAKARSDPAIEKRGDVLALLVQAHDEDGAPISDQDIADELLTLLGSGHETTASALGWAIERLRRHPRLLARLTEEADRGGSELRQATMWEVQRTRPVLEGTTRRTKVRIRLGEWVIPENTNLIISIKLAHKAEANFPDADSFNPDRYGSTGRKPVGLIPFGGGVNRCVGSAFANMEFDVVLRMLLQEFQITPTGAPDEGARWRGVATVPARGARARVHRRRAYRPLGDRESGRLPVREKREARPYWPLKPALSSS